MFASRTPRGRCRAFGRPLPVPWTPTRKLLLRRWLGAASPCDAHMHAAATAAAAVTVPYGHGASAWGRAGLQRIIMILSI